ncbi:unnamed protein product [Calicophoron daubneyi]|uniref:Uncharacterized protein n=1 Tax=Calicophoron daubneyi TaxID=300641 RepID=A0AAV2TYX8_CALDB
MESGLDEEDEALENSSNDNSSTVQLRTKPVTKTPEGRAPTITIDAVRVGRPLKVLALIFAVLSLLLFTVSAAGTNWLESEGSRRGLFVKCEDMPTSVPRTSDSDGCTLLPFLLWDVLTFILLVLSVILLNAVGLILLTAGMLTMATKPKSIMYKIVLTLFTLAGLTMITCAALYFWIYCGGYTVQKVRVGWSYIVGCSGIFPLALAFALLALDRNGEEVIYRETICRSSTYLEAE